MWVVVLVAVLYGIYQVGNYVQRLFDLYIPGSVIGMILLFLLLMLRVLPVRWVEAGSDILVRHLTLFFIPASVGIMNYFGFFAGDGLIAAIITLVSTVLVMGGAAFCTQLIIRGRDKR